MDVEPARQGRSHHGGYSERVRRKVRRYRPDTDRAALLAFRRAAWGDVSQASATYLEWRYPASGGEIPLWVVDDGTRIVAAQGAIPVALVVDGTSYRGAWLIELFVDPAHRWRGLGAILTQVATAAFEVVMGTELSDSAYSVLERAGWSELGTLPLFARPLDLAEVLGARLPGRVPASARRAMGPVLRAADAAVDAGLAVAGLEVREVRRFGDEIDALWRLVSGRHRVIVRRDAAFLNHRFAEFPDPGRYRLLEFHRGSRLVGYSVLRLGLRHGLPTGDVVDHLAAPGYTLPILARSLERLRREGAKMAYLVHLGADEKALGWLGFSRRDTGWRTMVDPSGLPPTARAQVRRRGGWYVTGGDSNLDRPRS